MVLPTYIPIVDAAKKYGYALDELKKLAQSGKINAVQLPNGDLVVSEKQLEFPEINSLEELKQYKDTHFGELKDQATWIAQAERDYGVPNPTISKWVKDGYIQVMGKDMNRTMISKQDVAFYATMHNQFGRQGRRLFDDQGLPYKPKTGPLAK